MYIFPNRFFSMVFLLNSITKMFKITKIIKKNDSKHAKSPKKTAQIPSNFEKCHGQRGSQESSVWTRHNWKKKGNKRLIELLWGAVATPSLIHQRPPAAPSMRDSKWIGLIDRRVCLVSLARMMDSSAPSLPANTFLNGLESFLDSSVIT